MSKQKLEFHNLHNLLPTEDSRAKLCKATGIPLKSLNEWLDPDNEKVPKADLLIKMTNYFNCSCDYLLDL